jgi:hypothetical protein
LCRAESSARVVRRATNPAMACGRQTSSCCPADADRVISAVTPGGTRAESERGRVGSAAEAGTAEAPGSSERDPHACGGSNAEWRAA